MCLWKIACVYICFNICSWTWNFFSVRWLFGVRHYDVDQIRASFSPQLSQAPLILPLRSLFPQSIQRSISISQLLWTHLDPSDVPDKIHRQPQPPPRDLLAAPQGLFLVGICISTSNLGLHLKDWRPPREACGLLIARPFSFDSTALATIGKSK